MALRNGSRFAVSMGDVFPDGCYLVPHSFSEVQDYDEKTKRRTPSVDKVTGRRVFQVRVVDMDKDLEGRSRETVVKIIGDYMPVNPTKASFEAVEFENLTVTPYVTDKGRMAYSLRATGDDRGAASVGRGGGRTAGHQAAVHSASDRRTAHRVCPRWPSRQDRRICLG
jgi:hypothetical protein